MADEELDEIETEPVPEPDSGPPSADDAPQVDDEQPGDDEGDPDVVEIEVDGQKYAVPKDVGDVVQRRIEAANRDYTQKTQTLAEERKALEAQRIAAQEQAEASEEELQDRAVVHLREKELEQWQGVDWNAWYDQDFIAAQKAATYVQTLRGEVADAKDRLHSRHNERSESAQRELATRIQETRAYAEQHIKGWTPEVDNKVTAYAKEVGFDPDEIARTISPKTYRVLYDAWLGNHLRQQQQRDSSKAKAEQVKPIAPAARGRGGTAIAGLSDRLSTKEWMERRNKAMR